MKRILLLEDRVSRQLKILKENNINIDEYSSILHNFTENSLSEFLEEIINDCFNLNSYDIVICHKSIEYKDSNTILISNLKKYCKKHNKTLVFFSGGISVNYYDNSEIEYLELNSKTFYSQNLQLFLEEMQKENENILMLCYGKNWKLNIASNILEKTTIFIEQSREDDIELNSFTNSVDFKKLSQLDYSFYDMEIEDGWVFLSEIKKLKNSLIDYCMNYKILEVKKSQNGRSILIHNNNLGDITLFKNRIRFITEDNIDKYISSYIIRELKEKEFDKIFIKDNLSSNYLELYGLRVAFHVRLSTELGDKRFLPIVIISEFDSTTLNSFEKKANILFSNSIYICANKKEEILKYQSLNLEKLSIQGYNDFLNQISIEIPKDTSGDHGIANKWSIYKWAKFLNVTSESIYINKSKIEDTLYFKYLKESHFNQSRPEKALLKEPTKEGRVLLIDDEWDKGWNDIIKKAITKNGIKFKSFEYFYQDKSCQNYFYNKIEKEINIFKPDVVVLDLRLSSNDHKNDVIDSYTGIEILKKIHEINAGIQVIMLTATSKSIILNKLYEKKILGYVKKEHPEDKNIDTIESINNFISLVDKGLERKYLKEIYLISENILNLLENDIFEKYNMSKDYYDQFYNKLIRESENIFYILDSNIEHKFIYAMISIASSLETILSIFIRENRNKNIDDKFWDGESFYCEYKSLNCKLIKLFSNKLGQAQNLSMKKLIDKRNDYLHSKKDIIVTSDDIISWLKKYERMIDIIQNPINHKIYDKNNLIKNLQDNLNK